MTASQDAARNYFARGYRLVRIPLGSKKPDSKGWPDLELREEWLSELFLDCNIGIILGPKSRDLVDIDLDCPEAIALADSYLPRTGAVFGRPSKPRSHRLYVSADSVYEAFADPIGGEMLLEIRAEGRTGGAHLSVAPPSIHPSGERIAWADGDGSATIDAATLAVSVRRLAVACLIARHVSLAEAGRSAADWPLLLAATDASLGRTARKWLGIPDPVRPHRRSGGHQHGSGEFHLAALLGAIPNDDLAWDQWNRVGLACWAASDGSEAGYAAFDRWSSSSGKYRHHETGERWENYRRSPPNRITAGTLVFLARQNGRKPPHRRPQSPAQRVRRAFASAGLAMR